jgi:signal transduction histidine kinase/putative methionine-R-sulfoxide reductase with GAF domain
MDQPTLDHTSLAADQAYVQRALLIVRDAGAEINRIGPDTSLTEALQLIAATAVQLIDSGSHQARQADEARVVIYTFDAARGEFDPGSRVSAGEGRAPLHGDVPRSYGVGATALARRSRVLSYEEPGIELHPLKYQAGIRTAGCYPLLVAGQPVGALYIDLKTDRRFSEAELLVLDTFVHLAAVAIHNTRQFEGINRALQRKVDELERLQQAERLISSRLHLGDTLSEILRTALDLTQAEHGSFRLLDKRTGRLRLSAVQHGAEHQAQLEHRFDVNAYSGVMGWVAQQRRPARIDDVREPPWADIYLPLHTGVELRSELAVPLLGSGGGLEGVLNVESPRVRAFDADHQRVLEALATQAVIAIQQAKLLDAIEEVTGHLTDYSADELFALLIERACDLINADHGALWELEGDALRLRTSSGAIPPRYRVPLTGSFLGAVAAGGRPAISLDLRLDDRVLHPDLVLRMGLVSALAVPLLMPDGAARGVFSVYTSAPRAFSDWDTRLLVCLANYAAIAREQAEALTQLQRAREQQAVAETFAVLGDIAANLLHRVNNLVGVIPVHVQGVMDKRPALNDDDYVAAALREIEDSARAVMAAARESMAYLRPLRLQPTSVAGAYRAVLSRLAIPATVTLSADGLDGLPSVIAGEEQLRLVLFNLIENAIDALADRGGRVAVNGRVIVDTLDRAQRWVEITVSDDGPGVPVEMRERIFDPEFSTKGSIKKLGFGLWWTKSLVQRFGGSIVVSDNAGGGSTFAVRLPPAETSA